MGVDGAVDNVEVVIGGRPPSPRLFTRAGFFNAKVGCI